MSLINHYLKEGLGSYVKHQGRTSGNIPRNVPRPTLNQTISNSNMQGVDLFNFNFQSWQRDVIQSLNAKNNLYVVASPGAGKTAPVIYWWANKVLKVNPGMQNVTMQQVITLQTTLMRLIQSPESLPKILYLCPVRQLVYNIQNEFREHLSKVILHSLLIIKHAMDDVINNGNINAYQSYVTFMNQLFYKLSDNRSHRIRNLMAYRKTLLDEYNREINNTNRSEKIAKDLKILDDDIYNKLGELIRQFIDRHLLHIKTKVDPKPNVNHNPIVTVSIYESGQNIFDNLKNDNLKAVIVDEAHLIQQRENSENDRAEQITDNVYPIIKEIGSIKNSQLILLSGTVNPAAASNLCTFFSRCFGVNMKQVRGNTRNPSNVSVLPMDELFKESTLVNILINPKESGNAIILFSKNKINNIVDQALKLTKGTKRSAQQIDRGGLQQPKSPNMSINLKDYDSQKPENIPNLSNKKILDRINQLPGAEDISDPKLLECVMSGFGYIYRQDSDRNSDSKNQKLAKDQQIVANLFSEGKIKSIIATDSIGIGVNMKVQNMYVPSVSKYNGSGFETLPISDASQLYNRVGRMAYQVSNIYTPEANMSDILNAISANNDKYDKRSTVLKNWDQKTCHYMMTNNSVWTAAMRNLLT